MAPEQRAAEDQVMWEANAARIDQLRREFEEHLTVAEGALAKARNTLGQLCAPDVYDVEYAEGGAAGDLEHFLDQAARMLRATQALAAGAVSRQSSNA